MSDSKQPDQAIDQPDDSGSASPAPDSPTRPGKAQAADPKLGEAGEQARKEAALAAGQNPSGVHAHDFSWQPPPLAIWRRRIHEIIFEAETAEGKAFDVILLVAILLSVLVVMLESVKGIRTEYGRELLYVEWVITGLFTIEYILRLLAVRKPWVYATSFFGVVDLLAILPTYLMFFFADAHALVVIRALRLLRVFRILKMARYLSEAEALLEALKRTRAKVLVFLVVVLTIVLLLGSVMYLVEGEESGFTSIPVSVYWAIVTMTTVGYGDIAPQTVLGQMIAALAMIIGYTIIVIPVGIFAVEVINVSKKEISTESCPVCSRSGHDIEAVHCKWCGARL